MLSGDLQQISAALVCSILLGCSNATPEAGKTPPASAGTPAPATPSSAAADVPPSVFTVKEVLEIEKAGEAVFAKKLANKSIEIVGQIWSFEGQEVAWRKSDSILFAPVLSVDGSNHIPKVTCFMTEDEPWKKFKPGQIVHIKGSVKSTWDSLTGFAMERCEVTKADPLPEPLITVDVDDLATEFLADADAFQAKYKDKSFIVTGKLNVIPYIKGEAMKEAFSLSAPNDATVVGRLSTRYLEKMTTDHQPGDTLHLLVRPGMRLNHGNKYIDLRYVHEVDAP